MAQTETSAGSTLFITSGGDYASQSGNDLVMKLVKRRLISNTGDFFHLPNYGLGLRIKEPIPNVDLRKLAVQIEEQVNLEPEVAESRASLSYAAGSGTLIISLKVRLKATGDVIQTDLTIPSGAVQF